MSGNIRRGDRLKGETHRKSLFSDWWDARSVSPKDLLVPTSRPCAKESNPPLGSQLSFFRGLGQQQSDAITPPGMHHSSDGREAVSFLFVLFLKPFTYSLHISKRCFIITEVSRECLEAGEKKGNRRFKYRQP